MASVKNLLKPTRDWEYKKKKVRTEKKGRRKHKGSTFRVRVWLGICCTQIIRAKNCRNVKKKKKRYMHTSRHINLKR